MPKKEDPEKKKSKHTIRVCGRLSGDLKNKFVADLTRGYSESELIRRFARFYYLHPGPKDL